MPGLRPNKRTLPIRIEDQYHLMVDQVEDYAILLLDRDGIILNWNKGVQKIKGYEEQDIVGRHFRIFYRPEDRMAGLPEQLIGHAATHGRAVHEGWRLKKNGSVFWGSIVITALHDARGQIVGFSKMTRDLTERKQAEDRLLQYARRLEAQNQELQQFAYAAAHDLKEPLRKIQLYYSAILDRPNEPLSTEKNRLYLDRSVDAARRMQQLIDDLLVFSRIAGSSENLVPVDLDKIWKEATAEFRESIDQLPATIVQAPLPTVRGVPFQLRQLFLNLLGNSLKYHDEIRPLHIDVACTPVRVPERADSPVGKAYYRIDIRDTGIGFDPQEGGKIFNLFERLHSREKYTGTGIGLAICKKIMENNKGFIQATGTTGVGATFSCFFPVTV